MVERFGLSTPRPFIFIMIAIMITGLIMMILVIMIVINIILILNHLRTARDRNDTEGGISQRPTATTSSRS